MLYNVYINQIKCEEWGINWNQGAVLDLYLKAASWATPIVIDNEVFYFVARQAVVDQLPTMAKKLGQRVSTDYVYRINKQLQLKGLILYVKQRRKDCIQITDKGKEWLFKDSDLNPNKLGLKSDVKPDLNPTDNSNSNNSTKDKFVPPTLEQVRTYWFGLLKELPATACIGPQHWADVMAERWHRKYSDNGYKLKRGSMKDWRASVRTWFNMSVDRGNFTKPAIGDPRYGQNTAQASTTPRYDRGSRGASSRGRSIAEGKRV